MKYSVFIVSLIASLLWSVTGYQTCTSNFEDAFKQKAEYYCKDGKVCCSSENKWFGCCPRDQHVFETPISIKLVLIIAGVVFAVLIVSLLCCFKCNRQRRRNNRNRTEQLLDEHTDRRLDRQTDHQPTTSRMLPKSVEDGRRSRRRLDGAADVSPGPPLMPSAPARHELPMHAMQEQPPAYEDIDNEHHQPLNHNRGQESGYFGSSSGPHAPRY